MDVAGATTWDEFAARSIARMDTQEENISLTGRAVQALMTQVSKLTQQIQQLRVPTAPPTPPTPAPLPEPQPRREPRLPTPEGYSGEPEFWRAFLNRCSMHFALQPQTFNQERSKVAFVLTLLSGRAALWGTAVWENQDPCCASFQALSEEMRRVFDRVAAGREPDRPDYSPISAKVTVRCRNIPSSSAPWLPSADGTRRRSGTDSCMGWLTVFRGKFICWTFLLVSMD